MISPTRKWGAIAALAPPLPPSLRAGFLQMVASRIAGRWFNGPLMALGLIGLGGAAGLSEKPI